MPLSMSGITVSGVGLSNQSFSTAKQLLAANPAYQNVDGYYTLYPNANTGPQTIWCDMTTDGGGWMMLARSHPSTVVYGSTNWGWQGGRIGNISDFTQAYQAGWYTLWHGESTFTEYIFGNRANINNNSWGSFVYKVSLSSYTTFITSDTQQSGSAYSTLKSDTGVYGSTSFPGMQGAIGYPVTGTANNLYYMRDCCGFSGYGGVATSMVTTYCGNDSVVYYSGPWCGGSSTDGSGNFLSGTYLTAGGNRYGGTNQYMIMVR
jgi:hypothetical protein